MKKLGLVLLAVSLSFTAFAQKDELKAAKKALKSGDATAAKSAIDQAESKVEDKYKAEYYFVKGQTYYELAKKGDAGAYDTAADAFQNLISYEKETNKSKFTSEAQPMLSALISDISQKGIKEYQDQDYKNAKVDLYKTYNLSKKDTVFLEYAAMAAYQDKDFDTSLEHFNKLNELGYTGISTSYTAINTETGERENMGSKSQMDLMVKSGQYKDPEVEVSESKKASIIKNIAYILMEKGDNEAAVAAIQKARVADPTDIGLITNEANLYLRLGEKEKFKQLTAEAAEKDPTNPTLFFNIGVINGEQGNMEEAKKNYRKALELDPDYIDANVNLGAAMLEKDKELVEEMNKNLSNFKKYDEIKAKQVELYKEVVPIYEKVFKLRKERDGKEDGETARLLMSLYENLEMTDKAQEMRAIWQASKE